VEQEAGDGGEGKVKLKKSPSLLNLMKADASDVGESVEVMEARKVLREATGVLTLYNRSVYDKKKIVKTLADVAECVEQAKKGAGGVKGGNALEDVKKWQKVGDLRKIKVLGVELEDDGRAPPGMLEVVPKGDRACEGKNVRICRDLEVVVVEMGTDRSKKVEMDILKRLFQQTDLFEKSKLMVTANMKD